MRLVRPSRLVEVLADDVWRPGFLEVWRRDGDSWLAYVRYMTGPGMRRPGLSRPSPTSAAGGRAGLVDPMALLV